MVIYDVTIFTGLFIEGFVYEGLEKFRVLGCVRFMTFPAIQRGGIDAEMGLAEGGFLIVMTFFAQTLNGRRNQGGFIGKMGLMTGLAVLQVIGGMDEELRSFRVQRISRFFAQNFKGSRLGPSGSRIHL